MGKKTKGWLIAGTILFLLGCMLMGGALMGLNWNFSKLSTTKYETNSYTISESFQNISILANTADIVFVPSESGCAVVCYEENKAKHSVSVKEDTLVIELVDNRKWYDHIGFQFDTPKITVQIPNGEYGTLHLTSDTGDVMLPEHYRFQSIDISLSTGDITCRSSCLEDARIRTTTGKIHLENLSAKALDLSVSTGNVTVNALTCDELFQLHVSTGHGKLTDVACKSFTSHGNTGDLTLQNVIAEETITLRRSTGYVTFDRCDAREIFVETDTGDVKGTLLTDKVFFAQTDTGNVNVPKTMTGGKCEITTSTGDISIQIDPK